MGDVCEFCRKVGTGTYPTVGDRLPPHYWLCPFSAVGDPVPVDIHGMMVGDPRDSARGSFDGTYPHAPDGGERRAGYKNPPPPGVAS